MAFQSDEQHEQAFKGVDQMQRVCTIAIIPTAITTKVLLHWIAMEFALVTSKIPYFVSFKFFG